MSNIIPLNIQRFASGEFEFDNHNTSSGTYIQGKIVWSSTSNGALLNTSNVTTDIYVKKNVSYATTGKDWRVSITINGNTYSVSSIASSVTVGTSYVKLLSYTVNGIAHDKDGSKTITISGRVQGPTGTSIASLYSEGSADCKLDTIPRYFTNTPYIVEASKTDTTATINWSTSETCNWVRYHLNGSSSWADVFSGSATSGSFTISGLSQSTYYTVYAECRRADSDLWSNSNTIGITTYTKPTLSLSLTDRDETSLTFKATPNIALSSKTWILRDSSGNVIEYSTSTDESHTVSNLTENTNYTMSVYCVSNDGNITSDTYTLSTSTYPYPYPDSVSSNVIGEAFTVNVYNPKGRTYTLQLISNENDEVIGSYSGAIYGDIVGFDDNGTISAMYASIPSKQSGTYYAKLTYGENVRTSSNGTYSIKGTEYPTFDSSYWGYTTDLGTLTGNDTNVIIGGYSTVTFKVNKAATSNYSASGFSYEMAWGSQKSTITDISKSVSIKGSTGNSLKVTATDNRLLPRESSKSIIDSNYIAYVSPTITATAQRLNGIDEETRLDLSGTFYATKFGPSGVTNTVNSIVYYTQKSGSSDWSGPYTIPVSSLTIDTTKGKYSIDGFLIHLDGSSGGFPTGSRYNVKVIMNDALGLLATCQIITIVTDGKIARDIYQTKDGEYHEGINGRADKNYTEKVNGTIDITGNSTMEGTLNVSGKATLNNSLDVASNINTTSGAFQHNGTNILRNNGSITVLSSKNNTICFRPEGDTTYNNQATLETSGLLTTISEKTGAMTVTGNESVGGTLTASGATTLNSSLSVSGVATLNGSTKITNAAEIDIPSTGYIKFTNAGGYYTDPYGNFAHSRDTSTDTWAIKNYAGTVVTKVGWENGDITTEGYFTSKSIHEFQKPIFTRLLFYGSHFYQKDQWNDITHLYGLVGGGEPARKPNHQRWYRVAVWNNDNVTSGNGVAIGIFDSGGTYKEGWYISNTYGSGGSDWGNWKISTAVSWDNLNVGWLYLKSIIPSGSSGTQGYLFCMELLAYDVPTGMNPNDYTY